MKYIIILTGVFLCFGNIIVGQDKLTTKSRAATKLYEQAGEKYGRMEYNNAVRLLQLAIEKDDRFIEAYLLLGDIYDKQREYHKEMEVLQKAVTIDSTFFKMTHFNIGVAAYNAGAYADAVSWLMRYKTNNPDVRAIERVDGWLVKAQLAKESVENAYEINLVSAGDGINSEFDEYWPSITADEQTMVVTVLLPRNMELFRERELPKSSMYFQEDFFVSERSDESVWQNRFPLEGQINTQTNEGAQSLSADGNVMFFTACGRDDTKGSCDIYFSYKTESGWSVPKNVGAPVNSPYWESQPCFAADGQTLLFVSNRPGGSGGKDMWQATIQGYLADGTPYFGDLNNLGSTVNTPGDENSPFLHHDNETLYFSSDGLPGMGSVDIFMSRRGGDGSWGLPVNLGYPINTEGEEIGLTINARGNRAYFSADNREGKRKGKDIYYFNLPTVLQPKPALYVKGRVFDAETQKSLPADFQLQDISTGKLVVTSRGNSFSGEFLVSLPVGRKYAFRAEYPGYMFYSGHFDVDMSHPLDKPYRLDIGLNPIKAGVTITLENIFFETNSYELLEPSKVELNVLVKFMQDNASVKLLIGGHTDNVGSAAYNQKLSESRAESVYKYLVSNNIATDRLQFKGFGMNKPVESNDTDEGRAKNRRTEITIL
ncbi:MAG: OmpA family protein [Cytophagaceae bacterium]|jgi:outer membrane protein OmpA-like peptidoglycan-associated protein/Tfp pilus assembly protein PilF|nr:OmpA family protein [Cytophagaceae bacterium]